MNECEINIYLSKGHFTRVSHQTMITLLIYFLLTHKGSGSLCRNSIGKTMFDAL